MNEAIGVALLANGAVEDFDLIAERYNLAQAGQDKLEMTDTFLKYMLKTKDAARLKKGIDYVLKFKETIPEQYSSFTDPVFKSGLEKIAKANTGEVADYIKNNLKK